MREVKSKYKNPDKYIERLKADRDYERNTKNQWREDYYAERGRHWFNYGSGVTVGVLLMNGLNNAQLAQEVVLKGRIAGYKLRADGSHDITFAINSVRLKG